MGERRRHSLAGCEASCFLALQKIITIFDTCSRFSPAIEPRFSFRGADVVKVLERVGREMGIPAVIRSTKAQNLSRAIRTYGPTNVVSRSTSHDRASRPTMPSSSRSTASSAPNAGTPTGS